jgi:ferredoxin
MNKQVGILYFSPTKTTKKICTAVAMGLGVTHPQIVDITNPDTRRQIIETPHIVTADMDHLIVGAPVHSGKLPIPVIECLRAIPGKGKTCTAIVVYGNRDFGIALFSLVETLIANGFNITSAAAFIGQHSYSDLVPAAMGRPDPSDMEKAVRFGAASLCCSGNLRLQDVPIQLDNMSKSKKYTALKPIHIKKYCIQCGKCAENCPVGLLSIDTGLYLDRAAKKQCLGCMACVRSCVKKAKVVKANPLVKLIMNHILRQASRERKEPVTIIQADNKRR